MTTTAGISIVECNFRFLNSNLKALPNVGLSKLFLRWIQALMSFQVQDIINTHFTSDQSIHAC